MGNKTKQTLIIAIVTLLITAGLCSFLFNEIRTQTLMIEEKVTILSENNAKEAAFNNLNKQVKDTELERTELAQVFIHDESESIKFLNEIEALAPTYGLTFKTEALEKSKDEGSEDEYIRMVFSYTGKKSAVLGFTEFIETIPYHSQVDQLSLKEITQGNFEGKISIRITMQPL